MDRVTVCRISVLLVLLVYEMWVGVYINGGAAWDSIGQPDTQDNSYKAVSAAVL
jgi:hypothetical protein